MARPVKTGLDYFPLHIDFFDDIRISALAVKHGVKGQLATIILLIHVYKTGYYLPWDDAARIRVLKDMPGVTFEELDCIVEELVNRDFFDKVLFDLQHVLTSREVQKHFFNATKRRRYNIAEMPFLLAEADNTPEDGQKTSGEGHIRGYERQPYAETGFSSTETAFQQADRTQEYNKRDTIIKNYLFSSSSSSTSARTQGIPVEEKKENADNDKDSPSNQTPTSPEVVETGSMPTRIQEPYRPKGNVYAEVEQLKSNRQWVEIMCMQRQCTSIVLYQKLDEFARECICRGKTAHNNLADAQGHFCNWLNINIKQSKVNQQIHSYESIRNHKTPADHVADAQQWAYEETLRFLQSGEGRGNDVQKGFPY